MKILVLDPSAMVRRLIHEELVGGGYEVIEADCRARALALLARTPGISLLTTPVVLEDGDGFGFISHLRTGETRRSLEKAGNHEVPAIIVTANDTDDDRLRGYQVGAADFIQKPWRRGQLLAHVDSVLGRGEDLVGMQVLVADDSRVARTFVRTCLARLGVTVHEADDGDTALAFLREHRVDMLLTDLHMVRMDGDALCLKVRGELGLTELPVIFLTANDDKQTVLSLFKLGATDHLKKPFLQEELSARLRVHLERARLVAALRQVADIRSADDSDKAMSPAPRNSDLPRPQVLLVDDSPVNAAVGAKILRALGCEVESVCEGAYAVELYGRRLADRPFDLVLMDLRMPGVSGCEAARGIRALESEGGSGPVSIVGLSSSGTDDLRDDYRGAGMDDVQPKSFGCDPLRALLEKFAVART